MRPSLVRRAIFSLKSAFPTRCALQIRRTDANVNVRHVKSTNCHYHGNSASEPTEARTIVAEKSLNRETFELLLLVARCEVWGPMKWPNLDHCGTASRWSRFAILSMQARQSVRNCVPNLCSNIILSVSCRVLLAFSNLLIIAGFLITYPFLFDSIPMQPYNGLLYRISQELFQNKKNNIFRNYGHRLRSARLSVVRDSVGKCNCQI